MPVRPELVPSFPPRQMLSPLFKKWRKARLKASANSELTRHDLPGVSFSEGSRRTSRRTRRSAPGVSLRDSPISSGASTPEPVPRPEKSKRKIRSASQRTAKFVRLQDNRSPITVRSLTDSPQPKASSESDNEIEPSHRAQPKFRNSRDSLHGPYNSMYPPSFGLSNPARPNFGMPPAPLRVPLGLHPPPLPFPYTFPNPPYQPYSNVGSGGDLVKPFAVSHVTEPHPQRSRGHNWRLQPEDIASLSEREVEPEREDATNATVDAKASSIPSSASFSSTLFYPNRLFPPPPSPSPLPSSSSFRPGYFGRYVPPPFGYPPAPPDGPAIPSMYGSPPSLPPIGCGPPAAVRLNGRPPVIDLTADEPDT